MKWRDVVVVLVCFVWVMSILTGTGVCGTDEQTVSDVERLPTTLDQYYPPRSAAPAYLLGMYEMASSFSGIVCDVMENDMENARMNFEQFKRLYLRSADMIPEWKESFPIAPLEKLEASISSGDPSQIMPAVGAAGAVCHSCHLANLVPVQQKYHWGSFAAITLTDPLSGGDVGFAELMLMMQTNFDGIGNDLRQGQSAEALRQFEGFQARFETIRESCAACHETERFYYVSDDVTGMISALQAELGHAEPDAKVIGGLLQGIGRESCSKCHLVHVPAAYAQQGVKSH